MTAHPEPTEQHHALSRHFGWHYVRYHNGMVSALMPADDAARLAAAFGGEVHAHSGKPKRWQFWVKPPNQVSRRGI